MSKDIVTFIHETSFLDLPKEARHWAELCVLDLTGVGIGGATLPLSHIIRNHAVVQFGGGGPTQILFDGQNCSPAGAALAGGMTIDALDGHDGYNPAKGHVGCGLFPATLAIAQDSGLTSGQEFLTQIALGYELGSRLAVSLHDTVPDYHTSGAWIAVACAAIGARQLGLNTEQTRHAMGIAEYHGPRSQMMRTIDHPTMVKDGSGWGAMAGVCAAYLAQAGFNGAPALTVESPEVRHHWADLGDNWLITQQYFKPYPVCRWAQGPIEAVLQLKRSYNLQAAQVERIHIATFHESCRLATNDPKTTEEAQYSTSYPCAVAMVHGTVTAAHVQEAAFGDPEVSRLSKTLTMQEDDHCNAAFPHQRYARATLHLKDERILTSDYMNPIWTAEEPPTKADLRRKFHDLADPLVGKTRATNIETALRDLASDGPLSTFSQAVCQPVIVSNSAGKSS